MWFPVVLGLVLCHKRRARDADLELGQSQNGHQQRQPNGNDDTQQESGDDTRQARDEIEIGVAREGGQCSQQQPVDSVQEDMQSPVIVPDTATTAVQRAESIRTLSLHESPSYVSTPQQPTTFWGKLRAFWLTGSSTDLDLESYVPNYRLIPIISGIVIPFSILLEIPGLTEKWYIRTVDNVIVETKPNPPILVFGITVSLICALIANISLILRFMEWHIKMSTINCIVFLSIHDVINMLCLVLFGVAHRANDGFTYGQPYWMIVCSTVVSTFTNITLIFDLIQTPDFTRAGSGLTRKQRSLVIVVMVLLVYIALGALVNSYLVERQFVDSLYFTVASVETIGFGDIVPVTAGARVFVCIYVVFGIINLAHTVAMISETIVEALEINYRKRSDALRQRRKAFGWRRRASVRWRRAIEWRLHVAGQPMWVRDNLESRKWAEVQSWRDLYGWFALLWPWSWSGDPDHLIKIRHPHGMHLNCEVLSNADLKAASIEAGVPLSMLLPPAMLHRRRLSFDSEGAAVPPVAAASSVRIEEIPLTHVRMGKMIQILGNFALAVDRSGYLTGNMGKRSGYGHASDDEDSETNTTEQVDEYSATVDLEERKEFYARLTVALGFFFLFWVIGMVVFVQTEGWTYGVSIYFCVICFTTLGYGDYTLTTPLGRAIFVFWALMGVATMTILVSVATEAFSSRYKRALHSDVFTRVLKQYRTHAQDVVFKYPVQHPTIRLPDSEGSPHTHDPHSALRHLIDTDKAALKRLEEFPSTILRSMQAFRRRVRYFRGTETANDTLGSMPGSLVNLMDDIAGDTKIPDKIKREILRDTDARHSLLTISIDDSLRDLMTLAEEMQMTIAARDMLAARVRELGYQETAAEFDSLYGGSTAVSATMGSARLRGAPLRRRASDGEVDSRSPLSREPLEGLQLS